jgi:hypothetical protein
MGSRYSLDAGLNTKAREKARRDRTRASAFRQLGNECARCGIDDPRVFQIDHINDDGYLDKWDQMTKWKDVLRNPHRYQLLCANCHQIKTLYRDDF